MNNLEIQTSLRFGVMCNGKTMPAWQAETVRFLLQVPGVELCLLIIDPRQVERRPFLQRLKGLLKRPDAIWSVYETYWVQRCAHSLRMESMSAICPNVESIVCAPVKVGRFSEYFSDEDINRIREYKLDFILRFAYGIIRGKILNTARYGIWSFHHDDEQKYRGQPPCFWEIYKDDPVTGVMFQRLTDRLDGGIVLFKGYFKTDKSSYISNMDQAFYRSSVWPAKICHEILNNGLPDFPSRVSTSEAPIYKNPHNIQMLKYFTWSTYYFICKQLDELLQPDHWNVGIVDRPIHEFLDGNLDIDIKWLTRLPRGCFIADPFGLEIDGKLVIVAEEYNYKSKKGSIVKLNDDAQHERQKLLVTPFHESYPYLFKHGSSIYCLPEIAESGKVMLYRADSFPCHWIEESVLIDNFHAIDPTLIFYNDYWWLFCTDLLGDCNAELYLWYSKKLTGPYQSHPSNPVKVDVRSSRPAGTPFIHEEILYRPAQDCSETYGGAVVINQVHEITKSRFREEVLIYQPPPGESFNAGFHTLASVGDITLIDGKEKRFSFHNFISCGIGKVRRLIP